MQTVSFDVGEREWVPNRPLVMTATIDIPTVTVALGLGGYDEKTEAPTTWVTAADAQKAAKAAEAQKAADAAKAADSLETRKQALKTVKDARAEIKRLADLGI